ncbi:MAG: ABC transporter ATP-binding protein [Bacteroidetes bacterium]|nr:ABC transporter ATP-binding protein [Bacteroidota bacterium]MCL5738956.1 ABC transporter ATP-binding protein [Bacteroidota bacterium]
MIIQVENLVKKYGDLTAVDDVSLSVERGELVGMIGPDGAGKTTFLRMLAGALQPTSGTIVVNDKTFTKNRQELKGDIGYLSQVSQAYGDLTVWENIEFFGKIRKVRDWRERGERLLEFARLSDFKDRLADQLSGGMRQKLGICCAVLHQPKILILDEPTTGVDPVSRRELWLILASFLRNSMTILVATPYLTEAERCNKVALFDQGKLLRYNTVPALTSEMALRVYEIHSRNLKEAFAVVSRFNVAENLVVLGDRISFVTAEFSQDKVESVFNAVRKEVDSGATLKEIGATLDNIFSTLIKS